jgi:hypothetical protein
MELTRIKYQRYKLLHCFQKTSYTALFIELEIGLKFKIMHSTYILYSDKY